MTIALRGDQKLMLLLNDKTNFSDVMRLIINTGVTLISDTGAHNIYQWNFGRLLTPVIFVKDYIKLVIDDISYLLRHSIKLLHKQLVVRLAY